MNQIVKQIPNAITLLNLLMGSLAVFFAIDGHLVWSGIFICAAAIFDFLDGFAARLLKAHSEIGKELDSLADMISFGLAPAAILFTLLEFSLFEKTSLSIRLMQVPDNGSSFFLHCLCRCQAHFAPCPLQFQPTKRFFFQRTAHSR